MRLRRTAHCVAALASFAIASAPAAAQSLLDRPDNLSTDWVGSTGTLYFNFVHRFSQSPAPERKVTNFPTFLVATGIDSRALVGFNYATNSALASRYPNEWEFFGRYALLQQEEDKPFDLGAQVDYNLAVKGVDGELSIARREGPMRIIGVARTIADTIGGNSRRYALGGGATLRFGRFLALAGDAATMTKRGAGEKVAWSAGVRLALPNTPHTLSLHVSNANTSTLQGVTRGGSERRYGFEFTIPVHLRRFFTTPEATAEQPALIPADAPARDTVKPAEVAVMPTPAAAAPVTPQPVTRDTATRAAAPRTEARQPAPAPKVETPRPVARAVSARIKGQAFVPARLEVAVGSTVTWRNLDALIHTVTAVDKSFNSGVMSADGTYSHTFNKPGTIAIYCLAHPFMKATVVVK